MKHFRSAAPMGAALLAVAFVDELLSGFVSVAVPVIRDDLALTYAQVGLLLTVPMVASTLLEPPICAWSDHASKARLVPIGLAVLGVAWAVSAAAPGFAWLLVALSLLWVAGVSVGLAQAWLIDLRPTRQHAVMARWTLLGALGDLLAPLAVAAMLALGAGWRSMFLAAAAVWLAMALAVRRWRPSPPPSTWTHVTTQEPPAMTGGVVARLREALRRPRLLRWALLLELCDPLDETLVVFAVLYLRDTLGLSAAAAAVLVGCYTLGQIAPLPWVSRLVLRIPPTRLLRGSAALSALALVGLVAAPSVAVACACLLLAGLGSACLYPVMQAEAYRALPGRSGAVLAVMHIMAPIGLTTPWLLGLAASNWGLPATLGLIAAAPALVVLLVPRSRDQPA